MTKQPAPATTHPWNMRPDESAKAYQAFEVYRDMGPGRSLEKATRGDTKALPSWKRWSSRFDWVARVRAFDEAAAKRAAEVSLDDHTAVRIRQAQQARIFSTRGVQRMAGLSPDVMTPTEAIQAFRVGSQVEREALGMDKLQAPLGGAAELKITFTYDDGDTDKSAN